MTGEGILTTLGGFITGRAMDVVSVINARQQGKTAQTALKIQELQTQKALADKAAALAAAEKTSKLLGSKTLENLVMWTLTAVAGGILVTIILKAAGIK